MSFAYHEPASVSEALELLATHGEDAHVVAGATAFTLLWRQGLLRPAHVVALRRIDALRGVATDGDGLRIGAMTTHRAVESSTEVARFCPALTRTFASIATVRIRGQATIGGNLAHADPAQDPAPMLIALDASVEVASPRRTRAVAVAELSVDVFTTSLEPGEIITAVRVPRLLAGTRTTYLKFLPKTADDYATVSVAAALRIEGDAVADVRVALGAVGPTARRARSVEDALRGGPADAKRVTDASELVVNDIEPFDDVRGSAEYKREMARVWTARALTSLLEANA